MKELSILIVGVGGQGTLLASRIIGNVAIEKGYDVKVSEVHGMSQRGGSVVTYVRFSQDKVYSPIIDEGQGDIILAFETLEAYRYIGFLKTGGQIFVNDQQINPMPVITGAASYPESVLEKVEKLGFQVTAVDALAVAAEAGSPKAVNTVLIGLLAANLPISKEDWLRVLGRTVPEKLLKINLKAFEAGWSHPLAVARRSDLSCAMADEKK